MMLDHFNPFTLLQKKKLSWNNLLDNIISGAVWRWPGGKHAGVAGGDPQGRQEEGRGELRARAAAAGDFNFMEFHVS